MMEDLHRLLALADLEAERPACPDIGHRHDQLTVTLVPHQSDMDAVVHAAVQFSHLCGNLNSHVPLSIGRTSASWRVAARKNRDIRITRVFRGRFSAERSPVIPLSAAVLPQVSAVAPFYASDVLLCAERGVRVPRSGRAQASSARSCVSSPELRLESADALRRRRCLRRGLLDASLRALELRRGLRGLTPRLGRPALRFAQRAGKLLVARAGTLELASDRTRPALSGRMLGGLALCGLALCGLALCGLALCGLGRRGVVRFAPAASTSGAESQTRAQALCPS